MKEFLEKVKVQYNRLRTAYTSKFKLPSAVQLRIDGVRMYLQARPILKYSLYGCTIMVLLLASFVIFVQTQTPSRSELTSIRNAVASEVYSADSVLLGR